MEGEDIPTTIGETGAESGGSHVGRLNVPMEVPVPGFSGHVISDEQLQMLAESQRDGMSEGFWGVVGIFFGGLIPSISSLRASYWVEEPQKVALGGVELLQLVITGGALMLVMAIALWKRKRKSPGELAALIRERTKDAKKHTGEGA